MRKRVNKQQCIKLINHLAFNFGRSIGKSLSLRLYGYTSTRHNALTQAHDIYPG